jgi:hypothetical protein
MANDVLSDLITRLTRQTAPMPVKEGAAPLKAPVDLHVAVRNRESEVLAMEQIREEIVNLKWKSKKKKTTALTSQGSGRVSHGTNSRTPRT